MSEAGTGLLNFGELLERTAELVATVAAEALDETHARVESRRFGQLALLGVALDALSFHERYRDHRRADVMAAMVVVFFFPLGLLGRVARRVRREGKVDRLRNARVAGRAAHFFDGVLGGRAHHKVKLGVRLVRLREVFETFLVGHRVAGHAAVDARNLVEEVIVLEVREHDLVNLDRRRDEVDDGRVPHEVPERVAVLVDELQETVTLRGQLEDLVFDLLAFFAVGRATGERLVAGALGRVGHELEARDVLDVAVQLGPELLRLVRLQVVNGVLELVELLVVGRLDELVLLVRLEVDRDAMLDHGLELVHDLRVGGLDIRELLFELGQLGRIDRGLLDLQREAGLGRLNALGLAGVALPRTVVVFDHRPNDGDEEQDRPDREPLGEGLRVVNGVLRRHRCIA